ncbi:hypothetical protein BDZ91DRAFT_725649 [Kalaharituber pfeilii]|nr:hypothetical protein BDZ91DRAFT_725649 [Kalaharituber pfeilii]
MFSQNCYYENPNGGLVTRKSTMSIFSVAGCMLRFAVRNTSEVPNSEYAILGDLGWIGS